MKDIFLALKFKKIGYSKCLAFDNFLMFLDLTKIASILLTLSSLSITSLLSALNTFKAKLDNPVVF